MKNDAFSSTCPNCNREFTGQHNFCPYCGHDMRQVAAAQPPPMTSTPPQPPTTNHQPPAPPPAKQVKPAKKTRLNGRFHLINRRALFGWLGLVDLPLLLILAAYIYFSNGGNVGIPDPPPALACDSLDTAAFTPTRFESGLSGELGEDTLFLANTEYLIQGTLTIRQNRRLLIQPGARLEFEEGAAIEVRGAFYACGSEKEPITFTTEAGQPGSWQGLRFINADENSAITHALIQFAGDRTIYLENSAPALVDVKIAGSSGFPISSDGNKLPQVMSNVVFDKNPFDGIEIRGGKTADTQNITWPNHGFVYVVSGPLEIGANTTLLVEPEVTVKFWQPPRGNPPGLRIRGLLKAESVQFTSVYDSRDNVGGVTYVEARDPAAGDWAGIDFLESSGKSFLRDVLVQYAGNGQGAIAMQASSPDVINVTIADSAWYPLSADADSFPEFSNLTLTNNDPGNALEIRGGTAVTGREERTWGVLGGSVQIVRVIRGNVTVGPEATLTIEPGVIIKFEPKSKLIIQGTLRAVGGRNEDERIVFTSLRDNEYGGQTDKNTGPQDPRSWDGIVFDKADDSSILQNTVIRYGSIAFNDASPRVLDNLILDSETAAFAATPNSSPTLQGNQLQANAINGLVISGGRVEKDQVWVRLGDGNEQLVRVLAGAVTVMENATLRIESGVIVKANQDGKLVINGGLQVLGDSGQPVIFTSLHNDRAGGDTNQKLQEAAAGDWPGLEISATADVSFANGVIQYANTGLLLRGGAQPAITGSLQIQDGKSALWCDGRAELPATLVTQGNEDNYSQCPTQ